MREPSYRSIQLPTAVLLGESNKATHERYVVVPHVGLARPRRVACDRYLKNSASVVDRLYDTTVHDTAVNRVFCCTLLCTLWGCLLCIAGAHRHWSSRPTCLSMLGWLVTAQSVDYRVTLYAPWAIPYIWYLLKKKSCFHPEILLYSS